MSTDEKPLKRFPCFIVRHFPNGTVEAAEYAAAIMVDDFDERPGETKLGYSFRMACNSRILDSADIPPRTSRGEKAIVRRSWPVPPCRFVELSEDERRDLVAPPHSMFVVELYPEVVAEGVRSILATSSLWRAPSLAVYNATKHHAPAPAMGERLAAGWRPVRLTRVISPHENGAD